MQVKPKGREFPFRDRQTSAAILIMLALNAMLIWMLLGTRHAAFDSAAQSAHNLVQALKRDIARNVELYDLSLRSVQDGMLLPGIATYSADLRSMILFDRAASADHLGAMRVLDASGKTLDSSLYGAPASLVEPGQGVGRDFFEVHRQNPDAGLFISGPVENPRTGAFGIVLSRRISHPDGSFAGVVTGSILLSFFENLFHGMELGERSTIALLRTDGAMVVRMPFNASDVGRDMHASKLFGALRQAPSGMYENVGSLDGERRVNVYTQIDDLPLVLTVAVSTKSIYADWWRQAVVLLAAMIALDSVALLLLTRFTRELRRRTIAEHRLALANKQLFEHATTDPLTGLANRRSLHDMLRREWRRAEREMLPLAFLMLDADNFKAFNDLYGHDAGDACLTGVAATISGSIRRPGDLAVRYGGEEFAVVLPATGMPEAMTIAEKIRTGVLEKAIPHRGTYAGVVSVSIGVACVVPTAGTSTELLMQQADRALYRAKDKGRNRVASAIDCAGSEEALRDAELVTS